MLLISHFVKIRYFQGGWCVMVKSLLTKGRKTHHQVYLLNLARRINPALKANPRSYLLLSACGNLTLAWVALVCMVVWSGARRTLMQILNWWFRVFSGYISIITMWKNFASEENYFRSTFKFKNAVQDPGILKWKGNCRKPIFTKTFARSTSPIWMHH